MKRLMILTTPIATALVLAACGSGGGSAARSATTVSARQLSGVGNVLVGPSGKALYTPDQETGGKILCTGPCTAFWKPLTPGAGAPTAPVGAGMLGEITRPDGTKQITENGRPLYTFAEDSPGRVTGNGFTDQFAGHHFTWHVVRAGGSTTQSSGSRGAGAAGQTGQPGGGYGGSGYSY
jgi:predicted lipoprotein with Yx(FWY)xxD motif